MATAFASSSRSILSRTRPVAGLQHAAKRGFASTSATQRDFTIRFANIKATIELPTLPQWLSAPTQTPSFPALAGLDGAAIDEATLVEEGEAGQVDSALEWDGILNAVPKSKVSHSRKRMRSANKGLKDKINLVHCSACGQPKLANHICAHCYGFIARSQKEALRQASGGQKSPAPVEAQEPSA